MDISLFLKGFSLGLAVAAPVGAIGVLCIHRTLTYGRLIGLISGLGAATADGVYGCIAGFGLTIVSNFLVDRLFWFQAIGGLFLLYLGVTTFCAKPKQETITETRSNFSSAYFSTFFLTLTNPLTILSFIGIFAGLGLVNTGGNYQEALLLVLGVFTGSAAWWLCLSFGIDRLQSTFRLGDLRWLNRFSGISIITYGILALWSLMKAIAHS
ncbi:LysE family translocator [Spirulina sp. 06S082]|uniref:LysE family translocator n=1 Tax=Spirulina sp. 06S082 TaxID=3110248 RepID=UPI002B1FFB5D|nr:LysE family transporter [Spirulina sp. 06S082]MEA5471481.1 LysE family transporter [Spirulina sp. 06S082]